jgi:hypothetical protein
MSATAVIPMPTSGSARRRAKAASNRAKGYDLESLWALINGRIPPHCIAASVCGCGYRAWLMPGASDEERAAFDEDTAGHADYCEVAA